MSIYENIFCRGRDRVAAMYKAAFVSETLPNIHAEGQSGGGPAHSQCLARTLLHEPILTWFTMAVILFIE
jgi:hypothetical protein